MTSPVHNRRLKVISFTLDGNEFSCQVKTWQYNPNMPDGDRQYTFCLTGTGNGTPGDAGGVFIEETDPEPTLELTFFSDWRSNGISDFLTVNAGQEADFVLDHHPNIVGEHVRWSGRVLLKAPSAGGEARTTEMTEITLQVISATYARI